MTKKNLSRVLSAVLAVAVFAVFQLSFTQTADAASGKKTVYVVTKTTTTSTDPWGTNSYTDHYTYYKNGLLKRWKNDDGKTFYKRNRKGIVSYSLYYNEKGKKDSLVRNTIRGGKITKTRDYNYVKGRKKLSRTTYYTYDESGNMIREEWKGSEGFVEYDKNGYEKSKAALGNTYKHTLTVNKHGHITKDVIKIGETYNDDLSKVYYSKVSETWTYTYSKSGKIKKYVAVIKHSDGSKDKSVTKFTYDKAGRIIKKEYSDDDGIKTVTNYTYKKFKVSKKNRKRVLKEQKERFWQIEQNG